MLHVYPNGPVDDIAHHEDHRRLPRVVEAYELCWACREGICVQRLERGVAGPDGREVAVDIIFHGTEPSDAH